MSGMPLACPSGTTCAELVTRLNEARADEAVVVDGAGRAVGIVTDQDIARRVAFQVPPDTPVDRIMTVPVATVSRADYLYRAIGRMWRQRLRRLVVADAAGRPVGLIDLHRALAPAAAPLFRHLDALMAEGGIGELRRLKAARVDLAEELLNDDVPAPDIQALLTEIDRDIYRCTVESALAGLAENGWGPPPVGFRVIVMGSSGRGESFLHPDQDNGLILDEYPDDRHGPIDAFFVALAERMTRDLDAVGVPLCDGHVMATNPAWRKTLPQWLRQIEIWARRHPAALLQANIFLDFAEIGGPSAAGATLRRHALSVLGGNALFLSDMVEINGQFGAGLGWFGQFATETREGPHRGKTNLKVGGLQPIIGSIRLYALREQIEATGTLDRIEALHRAGVLSREEHADLRDAVAQISAVLLRQQIRDSRAGAPVTSYVAPETLARRDRELLVDSLRAADALSARTRKDFTVPARFA